MRFFSILIALLLAANVAFAEQYPPLTEQTWGEDAPPETIDLSDYCGRRPNDIICGGSVHTTLPSLKLNKCGYVYTLKEYEKLVSEEGWPHFKKEIENYDQSVEFCGC